MSWMLASVLGQGDAEIKPVHVAELRSLLVQWRVRQNSGEEPAPDEEVTGDQLSALALLAMLVREKRREPRCGGSTSTSSGCQTTTWSCGGSEGGPLGTGTQAARDGTRRARTSRSTVCVRTKHAVGSRVPRSRSRLLHLESESREDVRQNPEVASTVGRSRAVSPQMLCAGSQEGAGRPRPRARTGQEGQEGKIKPARGTRRPRHNPEERPQVRRERGSFTATTESQYTGSYSAIAWVASCARIGTASTVAAKSQPPRTHPTKRQVPQSGHLAIDCPKSSK